MRIAQEVKPAGWLDDSFGCCLPIWYCPFYNFHKRSEFTSIFTSTLTSETSVKD